MAPPNRRGQNQEARLDPSFYNSRGPTAVLDNPVTYPMLIYPNDIGDLGHYVMFRIGKEYKFRRDEIAKKDTLAAICLPVPQNLQTGAAGAAAADIASGRGLRSVTPTEALDIVKAGAAKMAGSEAAPLIAGLVGGFGGFATAAGIAGVVPGVYSKAII